MILSAIERLCPSESSLADVPKGYIRPVTKTSNYKPVTELQKALTKGKSRTKKDVVGDRTGAKVSLPPLTYCCMIRLNRLRSMFFLFL